jgi:hypothetical protein
MECGQHRRQPVNIAGPRTRDWSSSLNNAPCGKHRMVEHRAGAVELRPLGGARYARHPNVKGRRHARLDDLGVEPMRELVDEQGGVWDFHRLA